MELVSDIPARLYPVGRLDKDSEGLLLMTNDGACAQAVTHPSGGIHLGGISLHTLCSSK